MYNRYIDDFDRQDQQGGKFQIIIIFFYHFAMLSPLLP